MSWQNILYGFLISTRWRVEIVFLPVSAAFRSKYDRRPSDWLARRQHDVRPSVRPSELYIECLLPHPNAMRLLTSTHDLLATSIETSSADATGDLLLQCLRLSYLQTQRNYLHGGIHVPAFLSSAIVCETHYCSNNAREIRMAAIQPVSNSNANLGAPYHLECFQAYWELKTHQFLGSSRNLNTSVTGGLK